MHDLKSSLSVLYMENDVDADFEEYSSINVSNFNELISMVEDTYREVEEKGLEAFENRYSILSNFDGDFEGRASRAIDKIALCSGLVSDYMENFNSESNIEVGELRSVLEEYGADLEYNDTEDRELECDAGMQMACNTLGLNQKKHTSEGTDWWAEFDTNDEYLQLEIWDEGPGLPEEYGNKQIFENGVGTEEGGKGLYLAKRITEANQGEIYVEPDLEEREGGLGLQIELPLSNTERQNLRKAESY